MISLNSANSVTKIFIITLQGIEPASSCVRDQHTTTTTEPARHVLETGSLNGLQFILH